MAKSPEFAALPAGASRAKAIAAAWGELPEELKDT
jgi:hypothetical protein